MPFSYADARVVAVMSPWIPEGAERSALLAIMNEALAPLEARIDAIAERILDGEQTLDVAEAAKELDVSERTVRRWIETGALRAVRAGHGWRVPRSVLEERQGGE